MQAHKPRSSCAHLLMPTSPYRSARDLGKNRVVLPEPAPLMDKGLLMLRNPVMTYLCIPYVFWAWGLEGAALGALHGVQRGTGLCVLRVYGFGQCRHWGGA